MCQLHFQAGRNFLYRCTAEYFTPPNVAINPFCANSKMSRQLICGPDPNYFLLCPLVLGTQLPRKSCWFNINRGIQEAGHPVPFSVDPKAELQIYHFITWFGSLALKHEYRSFVLLMFKHI